jgi:hypothetical protein
MEKSKTSESRSRIQGKNSLDTLGSENVSISSFIKYFDIGLKITTVLALGSVAFLGTKFVSRDEFKIASEGLNNRVSKIEEVLIRMEAAQEFNKRQDEALSDHEARIRVLEKDANSK